MQIREIWVDGRPVDDPLGATLVQDGTATWRATVPFGDYVLAGPEPVAVTVTLADGEVLRGHAHAVRTRGRLELTGRVDDDPAPGRLRRRPG